MAVFRSLRDANLKLSTSKCRFATASCTFLGFCISETGLSCDPRLIEAIAQRPEPLTSPPSVELDSQDFEEVLTMDVSTPTDSTGQGHEETETEGTTEADSSQITDSSLESTDSAEPPCVRI